MATTILNAVDLAEDPGPKISVDYANYPNVSASGYAYNSGYGAVPNVPNVTISSTTGTSYTGPYTIQGGTGLNWANNKASAKIQLNGENADVEVNGWSLVDAVKRIEERLNLLQPNPELEKEWAELKDLGEQYRRLEQHIKDKQATWDRLKAMPPPELD